MTMSGNGGRGLSRESPAKLTPRQVDVLELAAIGLSDDEIAARLRISPRSVRFQFEKAFDRLGVRDRSQAVAIWSGTSSAGRLPADRCPYHRPFASDFADCPTYRAVRVVTRDSKDRPTGCTWTCRNLSARLVPPEEERWYAACAVGTAADRERRAAHEAKGRLGLLNQLSTGLASITSPLVHRVWALKQQQRREVEEGKDPAVVTEELERVRDQFMADLQEFLGGRRSLLEGNHLSAHACVDVARRAIDGLLPEQIPPGWNARFDVLLALPQEAWPT